MDFRDRNPNFTCWRGDCLANGRDVFPFNPIKNVFILETPAPDNQTTLLGILAHSHQAEDYSISAKWYLIESSADCPTRKAFVYGELSWEEFWTSRSWLIELSRPNIMQNFGTVRYVPSENILRDLKSTFQAFNHKSPLVLKHETLKWQIKFEFEPTAKKKQLQLELLNFEKDYGQYLISEAA